MPTYAYADWPSQSTPSARLSRIRLHIAEVSEKAGQARLGQGSNNYDPTDATQYLQLLFAQEERLSKIPGTEGSVNGGQSVARFRRPS